MFFLFLARKIGEMIQFNEHIFEMGWNRQLDSETWGKQGP